MRTIATYIKIVSIQFALCILLGSFALADQKVGANCMYGKFNLNGKVKVVSSFPDIKVKVVEHFADLKVKLVQSFPNKCGLWQMVESFPDFKVQFVENFPDITIQYVESFPGVK